METEKQNLSLLQIFKLCLLKLVCSHKWGKYADSFYGTFGMSQYPIFQLFICFMAHWHFKIG